MSFDDLPAYVVSNENQRLTTNFVPNVTDVLTVAGSGDQALFYKLAGARVVDTFDITPNARVIQDIKYAAVKSVPVDEYKSLLCQLRCLSNDIMSVPQMVKLKQFLTKESRERIEQKKSQYIFGIGPNVDMHPENIPTPEEYEKLKNILEKPFVFILSDLESLGVKLNQKYDLINISNIFDNCYDTQTQTKILHDLSDHLKIGGRIAYLPQYKRFKYQNLKLPKLVYEKTLKHNQEEMILFQRTR